MRLYRRQRRAPASNTHPFVKRMSAEMTRQRATLTDVAERSGVAYKTIVNWRSGVSTPKLADIEAVFNVLGYGFHVKPLPEDT